MVTPKLLIYTPNVSRMAESFGVESNTVIDDLVIMGFESQPLHIFLSPPKMVFGHSRDEELLVQRDDA